MAILDDVKLSMRINITEFDAELTALINAAKEDLRIAGVVNVDDTDELTKTAIIMFVKGMFGYEEEADRIQKTYNLLKRHLALEISYAYYKVTINAGEQCKITFDGETKESNSSGIAIFYTRAKNHARYSYLSTSGYADISANTTIGGEE